MLTGIEKILLRALHFYSARLKSEFTLASASKKGFEEEGSKSIDQEPQKQLKRRTCGWLDTER